MFMTRLLNKLNQDAQQTKKSYYAQVERACTSALQDIRSVDYEGGDQQKFVKRKSLDYEEQEDEHDGSANLDLLDGEEVRPQVSVDSEKFFIPFELACKGETAKVTVTALDGIQKLVAYGELIGDYPDPKTPSRRLIDRIVDTICSCHVESETDEGVELQIIKALLTIVTSEHVQVHDSILLLILRTSCIIYLTTKSLVNQRTTRAMLTQMLHSIFHRLEIAAEELELQQTNIGDRSCKHSPEVSTCHDWEAECANLIRECFSPHSILSVSSNFGRSSLNRINSEDTRDINQNTEAYAEKTQSTEQITEIGNTSEGDQKEYYARESSLEEYQVYPSSIQQSEDPLHPFTPVTNKNLCYPVVEGTQLSFLKKDAFLSFWTLAKLALKPLRNDSEDETDKSSTGIKFRQAILAFHLLREILHKSGKVFKENSIFINAMKQHLCFAVMENGISNNLELFRLEVEVIMIFMTKFKEILVEENQTLLEAIIFPVLESTLPHQVEYRKTVLQCLKDNSSNLDCFIHLYTSYDYDVTSESRLFHKIVTCLNKIICDKLGNEELAIDVITNLLKSMSTACPKLENVNNSDMEMEHMRGLNNFEEPLKFDDIKIQNLELEGKDFLTCLHIFLANLDVPCDTYKVDWSVQKLAQKMTDTSSVNSFRTETADCWYALVYSTMSLIADIKITNCQGKSKMSKSQFMKLNGAINGCEPLDEAFLAVVYDEIEENYKRGSDYHQAKWLSTVERTENEILDAIKYILESTSLLRSHFSLGKQLKHVKRMIKVCGPSFLMALISALQSTNDTKLSDVCLDGIHSGIRVACILDLENEREAYVQALAKLSVTALDEIRGKHINSKIVTKSTSTLTMTENGVTKTVVTTTTEMKCRSVDIILTLLDVGVAEGNHLGGSWLHILKFISQLLSTSLLAESRNSSRSGSPVPPVQNANNNGLSYGWAAWAGSLRESLEKKFWDPSGTTLHPSVKESIANAVEKVFKRSEMLTGDAMTNFFQALCQVSLHDMMNSETPRHLMYEKINEVADGNFYRPALQWSQIWQVVSDYFCHLACSSKEEISTLAIDSILKLVLKLLKKETLNGYRFQNHYFSPFQVIIANTRSQATREAVLGFVESVISLHGDLLLSGWIAILSILVANMLSHNNDKDAAADSFRVLQHIVDKCQKGEVNLRNSFGAIVKYLIDIASNIAPTLEMSEQAFRLLTQLAEIPFKQPQLLMEENDDRRYRVWARGWKPIFSELSAIICRPPTEDNNSLNNGSKIVNEHCSWDITTKALITLFEVIKSYGNSFEKEWWNSVFETLFSIFSRIKSHEKQDTMATQLLPSTSSPPSPSTSDGSYKYFYCYYYVQFAIFDVYIQNYNATGSYVFDELLKHLQWCICQDHEQIALSGVSCLQQLVVALGRRFSVSQWDSILSVFQTICKLASSSDSTVKQNNNLEPEMGNDEDQQSPAIRAVIHLELLKIMERAIFSAGKTSSISSEDGIHHNNSSSSTHPIDSPVVGVNPLLTNNQISVILEILIRSHEIAKEKCVMISSRPASEHDETNHQSGASTFIPHETLSLQIYWKVLFAMFQTDSLPKHGISQDVLWEMIQQSSIRSCGYFVTIQMREHRDAWADLLCFSLTNILRLPKPNFESMTTQLYPYFCEMLEVDLLDSRICDKLREYLLIVGKDYGISGYHIKDRYHVADNTEQGPLRNDYSFDSVPKTCNSGAHIQFQQTCTTNTQSESYVHQPKDFQ